MNPDSTTLWPQSTYFTSLYLILFIHKMRKVMVLISYVVGRNNWVNTLRYWNSARQLICATETLLISIQWNSFISINSLTHSAAIHWAPLGDQHWAYISIYIHGFSVRYFIRYYCVCELPAKVLQKWPFSEANFWHS